MVRAVQSPFGQFTRRHLLAVARILWYGQSNRCLPTAISLRIPSELPDSFGESPSELPTRSHRIVRTRLDA
ncbi:hypothetical protein BHE74_00059041 [Ensete ventricosum]|nr:hypothetical protein BHE74_00059041 [Ensete ventricosum]